MDAPTLEDSPDQLIAAYVKSCREKGVVPELSGIGPVLKKNHGLSLANVIRHIKAYALEHPGSFPSMRVSPPGGTLLWAVVDIVAGSYFLRTAWQAYNRTSSLRPIGIIVGVLFLFMAKGQISFLLFLAQRRRH